MRSILCTLALITMSACSTEPVPTDAMCSTMGTEVGHDGDVWWCQMEL